MWCVLLAILGHAGALVLPPGETAALWEPALALAGLDGTGDRIVLYGDRDGWWLVPPGGGRRVPVPAPHGPAEREEVAVLAASLLRQVGTDVVLPALPPLLPPPGPRPRRPAALPPPMAVASPDPPPVDPDDVLPDPMVPEVLDELITLVDPSEPSPRPTWRGWWELGAGAAWREGTQAGPVFQLGAGAERGNGRGGLRLVAAERTEIIAIGRGRGFSSIEVLPGLWLAPVESATVGLVGGASVRWAADEGGLVFLQAMGVFGTELGGRVRARAIEVFPRIRVTGDLATTALVIDGRDAGSLSPIQIATEIAFSRAPRAKR